MSHKAKIQSKEVPVQNGRENKKSKTTTRTRKGSSTKEKPFKNPEPIFCTIISGCSSSSESNSESCDETAKLRFSMRRFHQLKPVELPILKVQRRRNISPVRGYLNINTTNESGFVEESIEENKCIEEQKNSTPTNMELPKIDKHRSVLNKERKTENPETCNIKINVQTNDISQNASPQPLEKQKDWLLKDETKSPSFIRLQSLKDNETKESSPQSQGAFFWVDLGKRRVRRSTSPPDTKPNRTNLCQTKKEKGQKLLKTIVEDSKSLKRKTNIKHRASVTPPTEKPAPDENVGIHPDLQEDIYEKTVNPVPEKEKIYISSDDDIFEAENQWGNKYHPEYDQSTVLASFRTTPNNRPNAAKIKNSLQGGKLDFSVYSNEELDKLIEEFYEYRIKQKSLEKQVYTENDTSTSSDEEKSTKSNIFKKKYIIDDSEDETAVLSAKNEVETDPEILSEEGEKIYSISSETSLTDEKSAIFTDTQGTNNFLGKNILQETNNNNEQKETTEIIAPVEEKRFQVTINILFEEMKPSNDVCKVSPVISNDKLTSVTIPFNINVGVTKTSEITDRVLDLAKNLQDVVNRKDLSEKSLKTTVKNKGLLEKSIRKKNKALEGPKGSRLNCSVRKNPMMKETFGMWCITCTHKRSKRVRPSTAINKLLWAIEKMGRDLTPSISSVKSKTKTIIDQENNNVADRKFKSVC